MLRPDPKAAGTRTLVIAHHFAGSGRCWRRVSEALGPSFNCVAPDLAGFAGSATPAGDFGLDTYATQLESLGTTSYTLVGHSMGAKVAMALAARRPPGLESMILVAPSPPTPEPMEEDERRAFLEEFGDVAQAAARIDAITATPLFEDDRRMCKQDQTSVDERAWRWWLERGSRADISPSLADLHLRILVVAAENDPAIPLASSIQVARSFAGSEFHILPESGHLAPIERPDALATLIATFLAAA